MEQDCRALEDADPVMCGEKAVVLAAVKQQGLLLEKASEACRADAEVVLAAVTQTGAALAFASAA